MQQRRVAAALAVRGVREGDRVAVIAANSPLVIAVALGALRVGVVPVMVNADLLAGEQQVILDDCRPALTLRGADVDAFIREETSEAELGPVPRARPMHYTSGTTGRPKGVWSGLFGPDDAAALLGEEAMLWGFCGADVNLVCSPLYHSAPLRFAAGTLLAGGDVVVLSKFDPALAAACVIEERVTTAFMAPAHLQRIFTLPVVPRFDSFRLLAHAGAPCPARLKLEALDRFPDNSVWEFYGSTEGQFTACPSAAWLERPGTVGRARPGRTLSIDAESSIIWCDVPDHARFTYWDDKAKTDTAWRGDAFSVFDIGRLDDEGFLFLDGRRDDLIITGGVNVYPLEIEIALSGFPGVDDVAVFGVDDARWGQRVCAAIVGSATPIAVTEGAARLLAPYNRPKDVFVVAAIPRSTTGKVRRSTLAADLGIA